MDSCYSSFIIFLAIILWYFFLEISPFGHLPTTVSCDLYNLLKIINKYLILLLTACVVISFFLLLYEIIKFIKNKKWVLLLIISFTFCTHVALIWYALTATEGNGLTYEYCDPRNHLPIPNIPSGPAH